jgi:hypothetical protein
MMGLPCVLKRRFMEAEITLDRPMHWTAVLMVRLMLPLSKQANRLDVMST